AASLPAPTGPRRARSLSRRNLRGTGTARDGAAHSAMPATRSSRSSHWRHRLAVLPAPPAGVGRACAIELARQGAQLCLAARASDGLEQTRGEVASPGATVITHAADVADAEAVEGAAQACMRAFGRIDVWINNAMATVYSP